MASDTLKLETVRRRWIANLNEVERLHAERRKLAMRCPHDWKYHPDPSGNNDSHYICDVCGRTSSKRPDHA